MFVLLALIGELVREAAIHPVLSTPGPDGSMVNSGSFWEFLDRILSETRFVDSGGPRSLQGQLPYGPLVVDAGYGVEFYL